MSHLSQRTSQGAATYKVPPSAANYGVNLFCVFLFFASLVFLREFFLHIKPVLLTVVSLGVALVPLLLYDFICAGVHKRETAGLLLKPTEVNWERLAIKLTGLYGTFIIIFLYYWFIYVLFKATYLEMFFEFLAFSSPGILILCFLYFLAVDRKQKDPYDEYWHAGCFLIGRFNRVNKVILKEYARAWFIKGFFTPYVFVILVKYVELFISIDWSQWSFMFAYNTLQDLFYTIDIMYAVLGYTLTCRLMDTQIRSTDPTVLGWLVCLICYGPFYEYFGIGLFNHDDGFHWNHWFHFYPVIYYFYGVTIIFLSLVYCLATVALGYRMSNLTYRGIITAGPYRFTKHPAYLCKVASWWLISVPFFSVESPIIAVKHTLALGFITFIYYMRAKTEENHLSNYPEYVEYAKWINDYGAFSFIAKAFPFLRYSEEKVAKWGSRLG